MLFMVEVAAQAPVSRQDSGQLESLALHDHADSETNLGKEHGFDAVQVNMGPHKHRLHVWATERDIKESIMSGLNSIEEKTQYQVMFETFPFYRQDLSTWSI